MKVPRGKAPPASDLSVRHQRQLLAAAFRREARRGWAMMIALEAGARVGSLVAVRRDDLHLDDPDGPWVWFRVVKGGEERSYAGELNAAATIASRHLLAIGHDPIVGVGAVQFRSWVHAAKQTAGLERVWPHLLRHAFSHRIVKRAVQRGDLEAWRRAMNHADLSQFPRYNHTSRERMRAILE